MKNIKDSIFSKKMKKIVSFFLIVTALFGIAFTIVFTKDYGDWREFLYTPTIISNLNGIYVIQDCWQGRIIYSKNLTKDLSKWKTISEDVSSGHSMASNGDVLVLDNSNADLIYICRELNGDLVKIQDISIANRPHFVLWDDNTEMFYVFSSYYGQITVLALSDDNKYSIVNTIFLDNIVYMRSASIIEGYLYIPDAFGSIHKIDYLNGFDEIDSYIVDDEIGGMNQITKIQDYYYLTIYSGSNFDLSQPSRIIRAQNITDFTTGQYEDITNTFDIKGTPYFISEIGNDFFITQIDKANGVCKFNVVDNEIKNVKWIFRWDTVSQPSQERKKNVVGE